MEPDKKESNPMKSNPMKGNPMKKSLEEKEESRRKKDVAKFLSEQERTERKKAYAPRSQGKSPDKDHAERNSVRNREFAVVTYLFLAIFLGMIAYFAYFQIEKSEAFINSPYNARQDAFADRVIRGDIVSAQGDVLATSVTAADGTESRSYPYGRMFAHAVGFSTNGKSGIESFQNFQLLRSHAFFLEKIFNELQDKKNMGDTAVTTLDTEIQKAAFDALGNRQGAIIAIQPSTGKILAMVSKPDFDPNTVAADWEGITADGSGSSVLLNRVTQGLYPPGSTFKIFTLLEYMREHKDYKSYGYRCSGSLARDGNSIHCFGNAVHGQEDLSAALANSCNSAFASMGLSLNLGKFAGLNESLLFNSALPCDFPYSKSSFNLKPGDSSWEIMQSAIGQGKTLVTPYHLVLVMSAIANDGILMKPYVIDKVINNSGAEVSAHEPEEYATLLSPKKAARLKQYLEAAVTRGTASGLSGQGYTAAGKTGSAEFTDKKDSHAWFLGYASKEGEEAVAVAVVLEGAGTGGAYAVPVAKAVFDACF